MLRKQKTSFDQHGIVFITHANIHNELKDPAKQVYGKLDNIKRDFWSRADFVIPSTSDPAV